MPTSSRSDRVRWEGRIRLHVDSTRWMLALILTVPLSGLLPVWLVQTRWSIGLLT